MPSATTPATVAATAATAGHGAGAVPVGVADGVPQHQRAAGRTAAASAGEHDRHQQDHPEHGRDRAERRSANSPPLTATAGAARRAGDADAEQDQPEQRRPERGRRSPRRPASTATTSWREARYAGTTAARNALSRPKPATPSQVQPRHLERPEPRVGALLEQRLQQPRSADAEDHAGDRGRAAEHDRAGDDDPAGLLRRTAGRRHQGQAALLLAGARPRTPGRPAAPPRSAP